MNHQLRDHIARAEQAMEIAAMLNRRSCTHSQDVIAALGLLDQDLQVVKQDATKVANTEALQRSIAQLEQSNAQMMTHRLRLEIEERPECLDAMNALHQVHQAVVTLIQQFRSVQCA